MDGLEAEVGDRARIVRVDVRSAAGDVMSRRYGASFTPTFVLFDARGVERLRTSQPTAAGDALRSLLARAG